MSSREASPSRASEQTPLLSRDEESADYEEANGAVPAAESEPGSSTKSTRRWPTIVALSVLSVAAILALVLGFGAPAAVEEYAKEALSYEPQRLSIDSFTSVGVRARIQAEFWLDSSKVHKKPVRDLGRFGTWIAKEVKTGESHVHVYLPGYDNLLLGSATIPSFKINVRNMHKNRLDLLTDLEPGDVEGIRRIAHDFMDGNLKELVVRAVADVPLSSGLISIGKQRIVESMRFSGPSVPSMPKFDIEKLRVAEHGPPGHPDGMKAQAQISIMNDYPANFDVPPMAFDILLPDCEQGYLSFATSQTELIHVLPKRMLNVTVAGLVKHLPTSLTTACPGTSKSPLDGFIASYLRGQDTTVYIRGGDQGPETPAWIGQLLSQTVLPVPVPSHPFDNMIKNFSLANVHFRLPETADQQPELSATVKVLVGLPKNMHFDVDVARIRADGKIFYEGEEMGRLDLRKWQKANSSRVDGDLLVQSEVIDAPLDITNDEVFTKVVHQMIFGGKGVELSIQATVDVDAATALGQFVVSGVPSEGQIYIKPIGTGDFKHKVGDIDVVGTSETALTMQTRVTVTNPTEYSGHIPFVNVSLWCNETRLGYAWASSLDLNHGDNAWVVYAAWSKGKTGAEFMSQYISGYNVSMTISSHEGSIPGFPDLQMNTTLAVPHLFGKFLKDTTMHLLSSTATFILFSPIEMQVAGIHANAYYNGTDIGTIDYDYPFPIAPGDNLTPRLPVDWNTPGTGLIRDALGGTLKLDALADVLVRIGQWEEKVWFEGRGLGAHVRL